MINGIKIEALLDTGSDVNLIREDISMKIGNPELLPTNRVFMGLGNVLTIPIGKLHRYLNINDNLFQDDILVVSRNVMTTDLILGHTLLEEAEVTIWKNKVTIKRIPEKSKSEEMKSEETEDENEKSKKEPDTVNKLIAEERNS